ncbi:MAG TPA: DJ-1/PfpI family protein [Polyangiaceae bacterium]|nr:DJ-1/PfpI family protein [Polyangiaceae bacterium]
MTSPFSIVFALYPNLTQLDFTGPFEVFQRLPGARLHVASREGGRLRADSGLVFADVDKLSEIPACDLICVPGGYGLTAALGDAEYLAQVRRLGQSARYVTSVCTGSLVLAAAGLLQGKRATCHWAWRELLAEGGVRVESARVVRDGNCFTGRRHGRDRLCAGRGRRDRRRGGRAGHSTEHRVRAGAAVRRRQSGDGAGERAGGGAHAGTEAVAGAQGGVSGGAGARALSAGHSWSH